MRFTKITPTGSKLDTGMEWHTVLLLNSRTTSPTVKPVRIAKAKLRLLWELETVIFRSLLAAHLKHIFFYQYTYEIKAYLFFGLNRISLLLYWRWIYFTPVTEFFGPLTFLFWSSHRENKNVCRKSWKEIILKLVTIISPKFFDKTWKKTLWSSHSAASKRGLVCSSLEQWVLPDRWQSLPACSKRNNKTRRSWERMALMTKTDTNTGTIPSTPTSNHSITSRTLP